MLEARQDDCNKYLCDLFHSTRFRKTVASTRPYSHRLIALDFRKVISLKVRSTSGNEIPERQKDGHEDDCQVLSVQEPRAKVPVLIRQTLFGRQMESSPQQ